MCVLVRDSYKPIRMLLKHTIDRNCLYGTDALMSEMSSIRTLLTDLKSSSEQNSADLTELKSTSIETKDLIKKATVVRATTHQSLLSAGTSDASLTTPTTSLAFGSGDQSISSKRRFQQTKTPNQTPKIQLRNVPKPKYGTRDITIGPTVNLPNSETVNKPVKPKFDKEIWVSGLHPTVTIEDMTNFVLNNTDVSNKDDFKCTLLVKKGSYLSTLDYVSFKLDIKNVHFDHLIDPATWPKQVRVREFIKSEPPKLNASTNGSVSERAEKVRKIDEQKNDQTVTQQPTE